MNFGKKVMDAVSTKNGSQREIIITFPTPVFRRFSEWAFNNSANCYWLAIEELLNNYENKIDVGTQVRMLVDRDDMIAMRIKEIENKLDALLTVKESPERRGFGKKQVKGE